MNRRRSEDRLYPTVLIAFLVGLVALGLLGVPALLVAAIGLLVAAVAIGILHVRRGGAPRVPEKYVPSVLEGSRVKRRRLGGLKRHRSAQPPLRFR
jgi:hypothetical protein